MGLTLGLLPRALRARRGQSYFPSWERTAQRVERRFQLHEER